MREEAGPGELIALQRYASQGVSLCQHPGAEMVNAGEGEERGKARDPHCVWSQPLWSSSAAQGDAFTHPSVQWEGSSTHHAAQANARSLDFGP